MKKIIEWCSNCEQEVELENKFVAQTCKNCGENLLPCSQCIDMNYRNCPLLVN